MSPLLDQRMDLECLSVHICCLTSLHNTNAHTPVNTVPTHSHMEQYVRIEDHTAMQQERDILNTRLLAVQVCVNGLSAFTTCTIVLLHSCSLACCSERAVLDRPT